MSKVIVSKRIDAPVDAVWDLWADFGEVYCWHPFVSHSRLLGDPDKPIRVGSKRQCDMNDGKNWVREEILEFQPGQRMKVDVYEGTMPLKSATATIEFESINAERSRIRLSMDFEPKFGLLGKLMLPLLKRQFTAMFTEMLDETERQVTGPNAVAQAA